jgi:hypothetical protein
VLSLSLRIISNAGVCKEDTGRGTVKEARSTKGRSVENGKWELYYFLFLSDMTIMK